MIELSDSYANKNYKPKRNKHCTSKSSNNSISEMHNSEENVENLENTIIDDVCDNRILNDSINAEIGDNIINDNDTDIDTVDLTDDKSINRLSEMAVDNVENDNKKPFSVEVSIDNLNIRRGPGKNYKTVGAFTGKGVFTIVEVSSGDGSNSGWGRLKSDAGWISLDFTKRV